MVNSQELQYLNMIKDIIEMVLYKLQEMVKLLLNFDNDEIFSKRW